jgi:hypothetical protein
LIIQRRISGFVPPSMALFKIVCWTNFTSNEKSTAACASPYARTTTLSSTVNTLLYGMSSSRVDVSSMAPAAPNFLNCWDLIARVRFTPAIGLVTALEKCTSRVKVWHQPEYPSSAAATRPHAG